MNSYDVFVRNRLEARRTRGCDDDNPEMSFAENKRLKVTETPNGSTIDFYLPRVIAEPKEYIDFLRAVREAKADDTVIVHINCYGGDCDVAFNIIDVLNLTPAHTKVCIEGLCASAATMIMLAAKEAEITEHAHIMIHAWSGGYYGKWNEQTASFEFDRTWMVKKFREIYKGFLTESEIDAVLNGTDMYLDADETIERLNASHKKELERQALIASIAEKHQAAINKELSVALANFDREAEKEAKEAEKLREKAKKAAKKEK